MPEEHIPIIITTDTSQLPRAIADIGAVEAAVNRLISAIERLRAMPVTVNVPATAMGGAVPAGATPTGAGTRAAGAAPGFIDIGPQPSQNMAQAARASEGMRTSFSRTTNVTRGLVTETTTLSGKMADGTRVTERFTQASGHGAGVLGNFARQFQGIIFGMLVWRGFQFVTQTIDEMVQAQAQLSIETARFGSITEQSIGQATRSYQELQNTFAQVGFGPQAAAPAITLVAQFTKVREEQEALTSEAADLSLLLGIAPARGMDILITAMRQAGLETSEVGRIGDLVADTFSRIPATGAEIAQALEESIPLANQLGISFEQAFALVTQAATVAADAPNKISNALQTVAEGLTDIRAGGTEAGERIRTLGEFGIQVRIGREMREIPDILQDVGRAIVQLEGTEGGAVAIQRILEALVGGEIRPERMRSLLAVFKELASGLPQVTDDITGALDNMTAGMKESFGVQLQALDAQIEQLRSRGDILSNVLASIARGTVGQLGGIQGIQATENIIQATTARQQGQAAREDALRSIIEQAGGDPDTIARLMSEHNRRVVQASSEQIAKLGLIQNPLARGAIIEFMQGMLISEEDVRKAMMTPTGRGEKMTGGTRPVTAQRRLQLEYGIQPPPAQPVTPEIPALPGLEGLGQKFREQIEDIGLGIESTLFPEALDATKFSMQEIADARAQSVILAEEELTAQAEFLRALGLSNEEIQAYIEHQREVLDLTIQVVRTQEGLQIFRGPETRFLQNQLQQIRSERSDFAFRRLRDVEPGQFGQLQALMKFYDQMLTKLGSPEEPKRINVLLGQEGILKLMTGRMTALQLALEDLTKVEKAQLSGTWNLPAGATALVPISSLDIQRWNAGQGGPNIDWDALANAEMQGSDQVTGAIGRSTEEIVSAILRGETTMEEGLRMARKPEEAALGVALMAAIQAVLPGTVDMRLRQTPADTPTARAQGIAMSTLIGLLAPIGARRAGVPPVEDTLALGRRMATGLLQGILAPLGARGAIAGAQPAPRRGEPVEVVRPRTGIAPETQLESTLGFIASRFAMARMAAPGRGLGVGGDGVGARLPREQRVSVNVQPQPLRATLNVNVPVILNGQVIARAMQSILYQMLVRMARSTTTTNDLGHVR